MPSKTSLVSKIDQELFFLIGEIRKGSMKIEEFLNKIRSIFDNLSLARRPVSHSNLVTQFLVGLDEEYTPIAI